jgi:hypothetical protein
MCSGDGNWTLLQLGFPIRTSPYHSSVVNFPGLIADSYVLHRLLMPRHPPCALSSLSLNLNKKLLQRCSRPLCSSQGTGGTRLRDIAYPTELVSSPDRPGRSMGERVQKDARLALDPSGPNSAPDAVSSQASVPLQQKLVVLRSRRDRDTK